MNCQACNNPTKYIIGLWDGENGIYGAIYNCDNASCGVKQANIEKLMAIKENIIAVVEENSRNNIQMLFIRLRRKELLITIAKMSRLLGISPATYSDYEMCQVALPVEMVERIEDVFKREVGNSND